MPNLDTREGHLNLKAQSPHVSYLKPAEHINIKYIIYPLRPYHEVVQDKGWEGEAEVVGGFGAS